VSSLLLGPDCVTTATTAATASNPLTALTQLIGSCESMEATYCMGTDVDVCRMFDQYLYKVSSDFSGSVMIFIYFLCDDRNAVSIVKVLKSFVLSHLLDMHCIACVEYEAWSLSLKK
jgi:hypothetical protein